MVDASLQGAGILTPVIDGVAGKSLELPQAPGMTLFVDASDLKTDLSGLGLIEADRLLADYLSTYRALLTRIRPRVDELTALWTSGYPDYYLAKGVGGLAQFAGEGIILLLPLAAALGAAEILASRAAYAVRKSHRTASLRAGLGERIDAILSQAPRP